MYSDNFVKRDIDLHNTVIHTGIPYRGFTTQ